MDTTRTTRVARITSASIAFAVAVVSSIVVLVVTPSELSPIGTIGIPVATVVGAGLGPRLDTTTLFPDRQVVQMAFWCTVGGACGVALIASPQSAPTVAAIGIVLFGLPAFAILVFPSLLWAALTVWAIRRFHVDQKVPTAT